MSRPLSVNYHPFVIKGQGIPGDGHSLRPKPLAKCLDLEPIGNAIEMAFELYV